MGQLKPINQSPSVTVGVSIARHDAFRRLHEHETHEPSRMTKTGFHLETSEARREFPGALVTAVEAEDQREYYYCL
jgi:hypothetical protein